MAIYSKTTEKLKKKKKNNHTWVTPFVHASGFLISTKPLTYKNVIICHNKFTKRFKYTVAILEKLSVYT